MAEIKNNFERWQLAQYLETARETEPFDPKLCEDADEDEFAAETIDELQKDEIRHCTRDLLLVERPRQWLLGEEEHHET